MAKDTQLIKDNNLYHLLEGENSVPWYAPAVAAVPGFLFGGPVGAGVAALGTYVAYPYVSGIFEKKNGA